MLAALLECLPDPAVRLDHDGRLRQANPPARALLRNAPVGTPVAELLALIAPGLPVRLSREVPGSLRASGRWRGQVNLTVDGGRSKVYSCVVVSGDDGYVVLARVSERRMRESLAAELRARDEFVATLGHELRTPLNAVLGFAQLLELEDLEAGCREDVERILTAGRHMQAVLDDVLDLARVRGGGVDLDVGPVRVLEVVRGVADLLEPLANRRQMHRVVEPAEDLVARADRRRLWQVLLNLVGNAVKYGQEGGTVRVGVRPGPPDRLVIEVADDGQGIPEAKLARLFQPFERLGAEQTGVEGTGLGLAMSQALVRAMDGQLTAASGPEGTLFTVELPAVGAEELAELALPTGTRPVVVHVGAHPQSQALVTQALEQRLDVTVVTVPRAASALDAVRRHQPSVVVVDGELPDAVGPELLQRLAADPLSALIPRVVLSGDRDPRTHLRLRAAGAVQILPVPVEVRQLIDVVRTLIRPARSDGDGRSQNSS